MPLRLVNQNQQDKLDAFQQLGRNVNSYFRIIRDNVTGNSATDCSLLLSALQAALAFAALIQAADPDIVAAYRRETGQTAAQVQADASAVLLAINGVTSAIVSAYPMDGSRRMLDRTMDASGNVSVIAISASSLGAVATAIDGWTTAIQ